MDGRNIEDRFFTRTASRGSSLSAAHKGYAYQDIAAAYLLVRSLVERFESMVVDRKVVDDDCFDDIEINAAGIRTRRQLKFSENVSVALSFSDFNRKNSPLRFDRLVNTFIGEGKKAADEYRLSATRHPPVPTDKLAGLIISSPDVGTFDGFATRTFRLDVNRVWPQGGKPVFSPLQQAKTLRREAVVRFCERFVIEVSLPPASLDLNVPGSLECLLLALLSDSVGVGRYPNDGRSIEDVAARAINLASMARTAGATLYPSDVESKLGLRTDFGRIAQCFPLDAAVLQERLSLRQSLRASILHGGVLLVVAGPGSGKSWALTQLAEELAQEGLLVTRHYCFLEPTDKDKERRVNTNIFFGNLLGGLRDTFNACSLMPPQVFAAGLEELETFLKTAANAGQSVVIIVDGVDHIARVRDASKILSANETDIVERLATLHLPKNTALIIGSQPGEHLQPLREGFRGRIKEHSVEPWPKAEVLKLAQSHGVDAALESAHLLEQRGSILERLFDRSEGNPLYVRYLSCGLVEGLNEGVIENPLEWMNAVPTISGDIARYYKYLYELIRKEAKAIADIVGVLEFSVTKEELREIGGGALSGWVDEALRVMSPILSKATAQGGLRIFHESFRRFMLQELQQQGRHLSEVLSPVIQWLKHRDFFDDAKCFRFMLPLMRQAGKEPEILQRVSTDFVQRSLQHGHSHEAIKRNLELASDVAAQTLDWPALVRCTELSRGLEMCFDEGTNDWQEYWETYEAIFGAEALADRLLFDGRPTRSWKEGLLACERVDVAGVVAPWKEYLALAPLSSDDRYAPTPDFLEEMSEEEYVPELTILVKESMSEEEQLLLAIIRGGLRLGQLFFPILKKHAHLLSPNASISSLFLRRLAKLLSAEISLRFLERLIKRVGFVFSKRHVLKDRLECALLLGLADVAAEAGDAALATAHATAALVHATSPEEAMWCVESGAPVDRACVHARPLASIDIAVFGERAMVNAPSVREWVSSVRLFSRCTNFEGVLIDERKRLEGTSWYRCWLRFVLAAAQAESAAAQSMPYDIHAVFSELVVDKGPFTSSPRECYFPYEIQGLMMQSLQRTLRLLRTTDEWQHAIRILSNARFETAIRLDGVDCGLIRTRDYFSLLGEHASAPVASTLIIETLEQELLFEEELGTYYSTHAEYRLRLARLHAQVSNQTRAWDHWCTASTFLLGYGFRKDAALFDIIGTAPALLPRSEQTALRALEHLQPLVSAILRHTDKRITRGAPNAWFGALLEVSPVRAIELLCREFGRELGQMSWMAEGALKNVLRELRDLADPMLLDLLWETLLFEIEYENEGTKVADQRLYPLERLMAEHAEYAKERFVRLCAEVFNDAHQHRDDAVARLQSFAQKHGLAVPWTSAVNERRDRHPSQGQDFCGVPSSLSQDRQPVFPPSPRFIDILTTIRRISQQQWPHGIPAEAVSLPLSYLIAEMVERGDEDQAQRLLYFLAHEIPSWSFEREHPIALLAQSVDNAGHARLAALALTLAFTSSRGGGYLSFGGKEQASALKRAMQLNRDLALQILAEETARKVRSGGFDGVTRHLIEQISDWGDHEMAAQAWEEAFAVFASRLPLPGAQTVLEPFNPNDTVAWSVDEALATLLLSRIGNASLPRKISALSGFARLLQERPKLFHAPLEWLLTRDATVLTVQIVLQILLETPVDVRETIVALEPVLKAYASGNAWTLSWLAKRLLVRAGRPFKATRNCPNIAVAVPTKEALAATAYADVDNVLDDLQSLWPDLPTIVARRMSLFVESEHFKHYDKERAKLAFGRLRWSPPTAVVSWPTEVFIAVLDEALMGLYEYLWKHGVWKPELEEQVADRLLPNLRFHLALSASRVPRPDWPPANEAQNQLGDIIRVPDEDSTYSRWVRLALYERQFFRSGSRDYPEVFAAVVRTKLDGTVSTQAIPLPLGDIGSCLRDISTQEAMVDSRRAQLVQIAGMSGWLGENVVLIPPLALRHWAQLQPPAYGAPLRWYDCNGKPAIVLRAWRVRERGSRTEGYMTIGCDLLMRPDLLQPLERVYEGGPFKELQRIQLCDVDVPELNT